MTVTAPDVQQIGLLAARAGIPVMTRPHLHPELEFNLLLSGTATYETAGGSVDVPAGRLVAFWGGLPHRLVGSEPLEMMVATLPLTGLVAQPALAGPARALLGGRWLIGAEAEGPADVLLLRRWVDDLRGRPAPGLTEVCLLEMQARLGRLGAGHSATGPGGVSPAGERLLITVARHYTEPVSVTELAGRAGVHPTYAAKVFTETFGMPLWRYVEQLRVAHAQRLLRLTTWAVDRVAHESGYRTRSAFYRAFVNASGQSPSDYRRAPLRPW